MPKKPTKTPLDTYAYKSPKNPLRQKLSRDRQKSFVETKIFYDFLNKKPAKNP
jgi:hypothetical protein